MPHTDDTDHKSLAALSRRELPLLQYPVATSLIPLIFGKTPSTARDWSGWYKDGEAVDRIGLRVALAALLLVSAAAGESNRALKVKVNPEYPELAKRANLRGSVRLELLVTPEGRVKDVTVLGGNPVLVQAAETAVRKWRYEPAKTESTIVVKLDFDPYYK
jgi:TonB family protein